MELHRGGSFEFKALSINRLGKVIFLIGVTSLYDYLKNFSHLYLTASTLSSWTVSGFAHHCSWFTVSTCLNGGGRSRKPSFWSWWGTGQKVY